MSWAISYRDEATDDIADAMTWYRSRAVGLDERFLKEVLACEVLMLQFPKGAPVVYKHFRQLPMKGFPYVVMYGLWHGTIVIYRVFHTRQDPGKRFRKKR
ncbi:MAG: type II toxin-antitoxin system RelE/ParE family toxin [Flavobacteriales bacterium]|nr:type II toxin-antitoxin system RelE/ParE family toxin [Flavobacteriales bacterium]